MSVFVYTNVHTTLLILIQIFMNLDYEFLVKIKPIEAGAICRQENKYGQSPLIAISLMKRVSIEVCLIGGLKVSRG